MSENKENKAIENNSPAMQRPGSAASMSPEIKEEKETVNKAPLQDIDSPFKAAPAAAKPEDDKSDKAEIKDNDPDKVSKTEKTEPEASAKTGKRSKKDKKKDAFKDMTEDEAEEAINKLHKRRRRRAVTLVTILVILIIGAILLPNLLKFVAPAKDISNVNVNENTLQYRVSKSSIVRDFTASGTLAAGDTEDIKIAGDIEVEEYFVENGDIIKKGDKIASVSKPSVMTAIVKLQSTLKSLDAKLNKINSAEDKTVIKADSKARVKAIFVKKGSNTQNTVTKNGALILLSLDGLMACDIERTENTKIGNAVTVVLSNKTKVSGHIASVDTTTATCVISDKTAKYKDKVTVKDSSGKEIGTSELYIHNVLPIISYSGKVSKVSVKLNKIVEKGDELLTLTGTRYSGEFSNLMYKRSVLEDQMKTLFEVYKTGIIYSDHDGEVTGIKDEDEEDDEEKSAESTSKLSAAPKKLGNLSIKVDNGNNPPDTKIKPVSGFTDFACLFSGFNTSGGKTTYILMGTKDGQPLTNVDYTNPDSKVTKRDQYTYLYKDYEISSSTPVYRYDKSTKSWVKESTDKLAVGDLLILTFNNDDSSTNPDPVWIIRYPQTSTNPDQGGKDDKGGQGGQGGQGSWDGKGGNWGGKGGNWGGKGGKGGMDWSSLFGGRGGNSFGGKTGVGTGTGVAGIQNGTGEQQKEEETYEMEETLIASIINLDTMSVTLSVDELDILNINKTQEVTVTLDAIKEKTFKGSIVSIDTNGSRDGNGNAKYSVKIKIERTDEMLTNMTASVRANISTAEVLSVPAEALVEKDNKTYCYTAYDKENKTLTGEVEVKTGISDGKNVEIVSGLNENDVVWYKYADKLVYSFVR